MSKQPIHKPLGILDSTSGREKVYRFLMFSYRFLSPMKRNQCLSRIYQGLEGINFSIGIARHVNRFGLVYVMLEKIYNNIKNKNIFQLSVDELLMISVDICMCVFTFLDHLIMFNKIKCVTCIPIQMLRHMSGMVWFLGNTSAVLGLIKAYKDGKMGLKEKCMLIKCLCDYVILFHFTTREQMLPNWICGIAGMISSALNIYVKHMLH